MNDDPNGGAVLGAAELWRLMAGDPPLVQRAVDLDRQIQPNGVDLTLESVWRMSRPGQLGVDDAERVLAERDAVSTEQDDWFHLAAGSYIVRLNEIVSLPLDLMALAKPRSSLLRCGVTVHNAVWDAGYSGRSEALLTVYHPEGSRLQRNARLVQLVCIRLSAATIPYVGRYQGENVS
jgi:dUTP pyrophosphatase